MSICPKCTESQEVVGGLLICPNDHAFKANLGIGNNLSVSTKTAKEVRTKAQKQAGQISLPGEKKKPLDKLLQDLMILKLPEAEREHVFHPTREWRFDLAWTLGYQDSGYCLCGCTDSAHALKSQQKRGNCTHCSCLGFNPKSEKVDLKIAVEYNGILQGNGASHSSISGMLRDYEKAAEAQLHGWLILSVTAKTIEDGKAHDWICRAFKLRGWNL